MSGFLNKLKHPMSYWILGFCVLGIILTVLLKHFGVENATATAWHFPNFLILITILYFIGKKPLSEFLLARQNEIKNAIMESKRLKAEVESRLKEYRARFERIEEEIQAITSQMRREGELEKERILADAQKKVERIQNELEFTVGQEFRTAIARLREEFLDRAIKISLEIIKKELTVEDERRLFEEYLNELGRQDAQG